MLGICQARRSVDFRPMLQHQNGVISNNSHCWRGAGKQQPPPPTDVAHIRLNPLVHVVINNGNSAAAAAPNHTIFPISAILDDHHHGPDGVPIKPLPELWTSTNITTVADFGGESGGGRGGTSYFRDGKRRVDFVLVYSEPHDEYLVTASPAKDAALKRQFYLDQLRKSDLQLEHDRHSEPNGRVLVFVKVHAPWPVLCREAERLRMRLPLIWEDEDAVSVDDDLADIAAEERRKQPRFDDDPPSFGGRRLTGPFDRQNMHIFRIDHPDTFFTWRHRTEIVHKILQECRNDKRHDRRHGVEMLLEKGLFEAAFVLHEGSYSASASADKLYGAYATADCSPRQRLYAEWAGWRSIFKQQPLNRVRNYFGEKVGFYFAFMDFYTKMLTFPAAFGLLAFVYGLISTETTHKESLDHICNGNDGEVGSFLMCPICNPPNCAPIYLSHECELSRWQFRLDNEATLMVACATLVWCAVFVKLWKRREASLAVDWDTYETSEEVSDHRPPVAIRAAYEERAAATKRSNPITMEPESYVPKHKRVLRVIASISVASLLLIAAGGSLMGLIVSRIALYGAYRKLGEPFASGNVEWSRWTVHGLIFCMVVIFEWIYDNIADRLTELECPKTTEQFLSSLLWKLFIFEELVDFLPIAYAAWFRGKGVTPKDLTFHSEICEPNGCMSEVVELVAVLLLCRLVIGNIAEVAYPFFKTSLKATFRRFLAWWSTKTGSGSATGDEDRTALWPQWLMDYQLNELKLDGVAEEYMEMMIQFSFVAFFVPAFPLIPFLCLLNNVAEIRVDGINFLASHRRPVPERVPGLQIWNKFMSIILKVAVLCNAALIAFTSEIVPRMYFKYAVQQTLPPPPGNSSAQMGYKAFSMSKMLVADWPELQAYLSEHPMRGPGQDHGGQSDSIEVPGPPGDQSSSKYFHINGDHHDRLSSAAAFLLNNENTTSGGGSNHFYSSSSSSRNSNTSSYQYCYYLDFRKDESPYGYKLVWWKIFCLRVVAFTAFAIIFYILLFLCDFAVSDVPDSVSKRLKRREYLVKRKRTTMTRRTRTSTKRREDDGDDDNDQLGITRQSGSGFEENENVDGAGYNCSVTHM